MAGFALFSRMKVFAVVVKKDSKLLVLQVYLEVEIKSGEVPTPIGIIPLPYRELARMISLIIQHNERILHPSNSPFLESELALMPHTTSLSPSVRKLPHAVINGTATPILSYQSGTTPGIVEEKYLSSDATAFCALLARIMMRCLKEHDEQAMKLLSLSHHTEE
jgi:hypothetical protein